MNKNINEIKIFISSTFQDLLEEREYLMYAVFPHIKKICRDKGIFFSVVDLRWGIMKEEVIEGRLVRNCLELIDKCYPYFIGILNERYGYVIGADELLKDTTLIERYENLVQEALTERISITELEIRKGVLNCSDDKIRNVKAFFYFGEDKNRYPHSEINDKYKLAKLKSNIERAGLPVRKEFENKEILGSWIEQDLLNLVNEVFSDKENLTYAEKLRSQHEFFAYTRKEIYKQVGNYFEILDKYMHSESLSPLAVLGESGIGKSALLVNWVHKYKRENKDAFVIEYYVGASHNECSDRDILMTILYQIKERYLVDEDIDGDVEKIRADFIKWLGFVTDECVIVIDGVNQLAQKSMTLHWMPKYLPKNIKLIVSSTQEDAVIKIVNERNWNVLYVSALNQEQAKVVITEVLSRYDKKLDEKLLNKLLNMKDELFKFPLFLRTIVEEMNVVGTYDDLNDKINHYTKVKNLDDFFQKVLQRIEKQYGEETVREAMSLIYVSQNGLSIDELQAIFRDEKMNTIDIVYLVYDLDYHLARRGELFTFFHNYLRKAVEIRYFKMDKGYTRKVRQKLIRYFSKSLEINKKMIEEKISSYDGENYLAFIKEIDKYKGNMTRIAEELPYQFLKIEKWEELKDILLDLFVFENLFENGLYQLIGYWSELSKRGYSVKNEYSNLIDTYTNNTIEYKAITTRELNDIAIFLSQYMAEFEVAEDIFYQCFLVSQEIFGEEHPNTINEVFNIANILNNKGKYKEAEKAYLKVLEAYRKVLPENDLITINCINSLAYTYEKQDKYDEAEELYRQSLKARIEILGKENSDTIASLNNLALLLNEKGEYEEAKKILLEILEINRKILGEEHHLTIQIMGNLATVFEKLSEFDRCIELHKKVIEVRQKIFGTKNLITALGMNNLAYALREVERYKEALPLYQQALDIRKELLGEEHPDTAQSYNNLGSLYSGLKDYAKAKCLYFKAYRIRKKVLGNENRVLIHSLNNLGAVSIYQENPKRVKVFYLKALELCENILGKTHLETAKGYNNLADLYVRNKEFETAERLHRRALEIRLERLGEDNLLTAHSFNNLGLALSRLGRRAEAEELFYKCLNIKRKILPKGHSSIDKTKANLVELLFSEGKFIEAMKILALN